MNFESKLINQQLLEGLNDEQKAAVIKNDGPILVLAGAGSGKTKVLTSRVIYLISEKLIEPSSILAVTFTNKAAKEMKARLSAFLQSDKLINQIWIGTFHGICNRLLRLEIESLLIQGLQDRKYAWTKNFVIVDASESLTILKESLKSLNLDEKAYPAKLIQSQISAIKNRSLTVGDFAKTVSDGFELKLSEIYDKYQEKLNLSNALDFDDLLLFTLKLFQQQPESRKKYYERFSHVLVDEFQDTNQTQYDLLKNLVVSASENTENNSISRSFCVVGDIDQSIYSWRGANYKLTLNFNKDFPHASLFKLQYNYRSKDPILKTANSIIKNNKQRIDKSLYGTKGDGEKITCFEASDEVEESNFITAEVKKLIKQGRSIKDISILYRTNAQSRALEEALIKNQIAYRIYGGMRFYDRLEIKDLISYLRLVYNPKDSSALKRVINSPKRGVGASTIALIEKKSDSIGLSLFGALSDLLDSGELGPKVTQAAHSFVELIDELVKDSQVLSVPEILKLVIQKTGYILALEALNTDEAQGRIDNIHELINVAQQFEEESEDKSLEAFLAQVALVGDSEMAKGNEEADSVTLMTIHSSKGLEFPFVFITGMEEGVFPHTRALADTNNAKEDLEEERRLLYVAITRAEEKLYFTYARRRRLWGQREFAEPSRFLAEMPQENLTGYWGSSVQSSSYKVTPSSINPRSYVPNASAKDEKEEIKYNVGDKVVHKTFGIGKVIGLFGTKNQKFYSIEFETQEGKKLLSGKSLTLFT
ncbi:MAG: 3'-5' exonuclease [Candidatus Caenarcaniphilales bacterium]|nr:3'-5' exonuclease [Candidatus Caenarcaniphilales bacterium]